MADRRLRRNLSQDEMNRGIGMLHSGLSQRHVANVLGVSQSVPECCLQNVEPVYYDRKC